MLFMCMITTPGSPDEFRIAAIFTILLFFSTFVTYFVMRAMMIVAVETTLLCSLAGFSAREFMENFTDMWFVPGPKYREVSCEMQFWWFEC